MKIKQSAAGMVFDAANMVFMLLIAILAVYPISHVALASISNPALLMRHTGVMLYPIGFSLEAYNAVFDNPSIWVGYRNTVVYVLGGTAINLIMTTLGAFTLSRRNLMLRDGFTVLFVFTMFFSGGLIPWYLTVRDFHMDNTMWALMIPNAISTYNLVIMRTFFYSLPYELEEASKIDGAGDLRVLLQIILPLSMPVVSVMVLYYGVGHWNSWFNAMVYLRSNSRYPLQLVLREILLSNSTDNMMTGVGSDRLALSETIKYATIMIATIPILCIYPFLQKYFVKGVMIGAIKG